MRRRWLGVLAILSFAVFAAVVAVGVRSFLVQDAVTWSRMSEEPMTEAAMHWAASRNVVASFIAVYRYRGVSVLRGIVSVRRYETQTPLSRWDDAFKDQVNRESRHWHRVPLRDATRGYEPDGFFGRLGFGARTMPVQAAPGKGTQQDVTFPLWPVALVTAVAPALWLTRAIRVWRRRRGGRCLACGYDMRGLEQRRCPECGMLPAMPDRMAAG